MVQVRRLLTGCLVGATLLILMATPASAGSSSWTEDDRLYLLAWLAEARVQATAMSSPAEQLVEFRRSATCQYPPASTLPCPPADPAEPPLSLDCDGDEPVAPLWRRERSSADEEFQYGWSLYVGWACPAALLPPFTQEDLRALRIEPLLVHQQPVEGPMLLNKPVIVYVEPVDRELRTMLLGAFGVDVRVKPESYTWEFGDGEKLTTRRPGRPYPAFDVTHMYAQPGRGQITLTTTWSATYRLDDDPAHKWRDVHGTVQTTDTGIEFEIIEWRTRLVDEQQ